jgi:hypothetical protein
MTGQDHIYDFESPVGEIQYLKIFRQNGCSVMDLQWALNPSSRSHSQQEKQTVVATIPYVQGTFDMVSRFLVRFNVRTVHISAKKKNAHLLRRVKYDVGLKVPGICYIPCECGKIYIRQTGCAIEMRWKEHV